MMELQGYRSLKTNQLPQLLLHTVLLAGQTDQSLRFLLCFLLGYKKPQRLRGKGIKDINGYGKGDQLIHVNVWTPKKLSAEERTILEGLKESENFIPQPGKGEKGFFEKIREFF